MSAEYQSIQRPTKNLSAHFVSGCVAASYRLGRRHVFLLIFAMSLIPLRSPAETARPRRPNRLVQHAQRHNRASLQTGPRCPSLHLVHVGPAPCDEAPSGFRRVVAAQCAALQRVAGLGRPRAHFDGCRDGIRLSPKGIPRNPTP